MHLLLVVELLESALEHGQLVLQVQPEVVEERRQAALREARRVELGLPQLFVARLLLLDGKQSFNGWNMSASGLAAVWSTDNSREAIVAAMKRRETYATTGPRIQVRLFAGWNFSAADAESADFASIGYAGGVPMGGELKAAPADTAPKFLLRASRGAIDHNLDRIQIIKGWTDSSGVAREKIFNVAWSGERELDGEGKLPVVGNTANIRTGQVANTIGAAELATLWTDPEFDAGQSAFYYARVLQIPTVRHSQLDAIALGVDTPYEGPATIQERAYTSPIWYTP